MSRFLALGCLALLLLAPAAHTDPLPLPDDLQQAVNRAIERGARYLELTQTPTGTWQHDKATHLVGYAALPGLTLLECGVSPKNPQVQRAAQHVRNAIPKLDHTYELALALLFLDRLGDKNDKQYIEILAGRLIAGQTTTGGWSYRCPILPPTEHKTLLTIIRQIDVPQLPLVIAGNNPLGNPLGQPGVKLPAPIGGKNPPLQDPLGPLAFPDLTNPLAQPSGSNNPFGLPVDSQGSLYIPKFTEEPAPKKKDPPKKDPPKTKPEIKDKDKGDALTASFGARNPTCLKFLEAPDNRVSIPAQAKKAAPVKIPPHMAGLPVLSDVNRHWLIDPDKKAEQPFFGTTDNSNSQFAILALWAARRHDIPMARTQYLVARRFLTSQNKDGGWGYRYQYGGGPGSAPPMTAVGLLGLALSHSLAREQGQLAHNLIDDPRVIMGFAALSRSVGHHTGQFDNLKMQNLYFLWSAERVGMLYDVPSIGGKDWYRWGAEILVANQQGGGNWTGGGYPGASPTIDTCLALLFLKRANLARDLTDRLPVQVAELDRKVEKAAVQGIAFLQKKDDPPPPKVEPMPMPQPDPKTAKQDPPLQQPTTQQPKSPPTPPVGTMPPVTTPPTGQATTTETRGGFPWWILIVAAAVLLGGGLFWYTQSGKRNGHNGDEDRPRKKKKKKKAE